MSKSYQYFSIPFDLVPKDQPPPYPLWFATWSTQPPVLEPGVPAPLVMGATDGVLPDGASPLGTADKDPPPPPPALTSTPTDYQTTLNNWLETTRAADE
jgi:hypothetical protein